MSSDDPLVLARYYDAPSEDQKMNAQRYIEIYGENIDNEVKYFYSGLRLTDNAKVYKDPSETSNDSKGNTTDTYFINNLSFSTELKKVSSGGLKVSDIKKVLNGTDKTYTDEQKSIIKNALQLDGNYVNCKSSIDITTSSNVFSLDPNNCPKWSILGYNIKNPATVTGQDTPFSGYYDGSVFTLKISSNNDKDFLEPSKISLYCIEAVKVDGKWKVKEGAEKKYIIKDDDFELKWDDASNDEYASKTFSVTGLEALTYYFFELEGSDREGNVYEPEADMFDGHAYGFAVSSNQIPPTIAVAQNGPWPYFNVDKLHKAEGGYKISGTVTDQSKRIDALNCRLKVYKVVDGEEVAVAENLIPEVSTPVWTKDPNNPEKFNWSVNISAEDSVVYSEDYYLFKFTIEATNAISLSSEYDFTLHGDNADPKLFSVPMNDDTKIQLKVEHNAGDKWYKDTAMKISGIFDDGEGSGVSTVYYWIKNDDSTVVAGDIDNAETLIALKNDEGKYSFKSVISGFIAGENEICFMAEDEVGHRSPLTAKYKVMVDSFQPNINLTTATSDGKVLTNAKNDMILEGIVSDDASGVNKIELKLKNLIISSESSSSDGSIVLGPARTEEIDGVDLQVRNWTATIKAATLNAMGISSSEETLLANVYDNAGNQNPNVNLNCKVAIDTIAPKTTINNPKYKSNEQPISENKANGVIILSGSSSDSQLMKSVKLQYRVGNSGDYQDFAGEGISFESTNGGTITWETQIDTTTVFGTLNDGDIVYINAITTDTAGNTSESKDNTVGTQNGPISFIVDQKTDRPILNISTIRNPKGFVNTNVIEGNITDDDALNNESVKKLIVSTTLLATVTETSNGTGGSTVLNEDGTWRFTLTDNSDGLKQIYFYIIDREGAVFASNISGKDKMYVKYNNGLASELSDKVEFTLDKTNPIVNEAYVIFGPETTIVESSTNKIQLSKNSTVYLGGTKRRYAELKIKAYDANGILSMRAKIKDREYEITRVYNGTTWNVEGNGTLSGTETTSEVYWTLPLGDIKDKIEGSHTITVTAIDSSTSSSEQEQYAITVDNTAPTVVGFTPTSTVITDTTLSATFEDNGAGLPDNNDNKNIEWIIPTYAQQNASSITTGWNTTTNIQTFTQKLNWADISRYSNIANSFHTDGYATQETNGLLTVPVWFKVSDVLGNEEIVKKSFKVNPTDSLATATITYPANGAKVGSTVTIYGTAGISGNADIKEVRIQIDANGDGTFDEKDYAILSGNATATQIPDADVRNSTNSKWKLWAETNSITTEQPRLVPAYDPTTASTIGDNWYIVANDTNSWKLSITASLFSATYVGSQENPQISFRVCAIGSVNNQTMKNYTASGIENGDHVRSWTVASATDETTGVALCSLTIDSGLPQIEDVYIVQYKDNDPATGIVERSRAYSKGMFISPQKKSVSGVARDWYLTANLRDETALDGFT